MKLLFSTALLAMLFLQSCTIVTTTNIPGKKESKFPKFMVGNFELEYPGDLAALAEGNVTTVKISSDQLAMATSGEETVSMLNDSIFVSKIGKQYYLSLGAAPSFSVFKIVKNGKDIDLYSMSAGESVGKSSFEPYFSSVKEVPGEPDEETGEIGPSSFEVTIDDKKLDSYFKSDVPSKDPFKLKRTK